jgi:pimeloyl-ACP methyl ester carboxylesterase
MMARPPVAPLVPGWVVVDGRPMFHRTATIAGQGAAAMVHVHGFGISGTYLEPTAAVLARRFLTYVPDLPGMGRSLRPDRPFDLPGLANALVAYCDEVGVERATFVGNSLGCPIICEVASRFPERIERAVLVSPAGGPNNQPLPRAIAQMAIDGVREPISMVPIAVRDYLRFGVLQGLRLFAAMMRFPSVDRIQAMEVPTLVVVGRRDPLVDIGRAWVLAEVPHLDAVSVPGAHALNYSHPDTVAALIEAFVDGGELAAATGPLAGVEPILVSR